MNDVAQAYCPECDDSQESSRLHRREFVRMVGRGAIAVTGASMILGRATPAIRADEVKAVSQNKKPGEELVRELYASLSPAQRTELVLPWNHGAEGEKGLPTRLGMYNAPIGGKKIGDHYTPPQQELIERILRSISADEDGYRQLSRNGTFDNSKSLNSCGALIFGDPAEKGKFSWVFTGHHLTVRCDGNSEEGAAFGGPMYYGHSPNGYSDKNIFNYQTKRVLSVFDALNTEQRTRAVVKGTPGEQAESVRLRKQSESMPGIAYQELSSDQRQLVEDVMRTVLSPYRREDADEVMQIIKAQGGMEKIHLAFYEDAQMNDGQRWHFWRLEGPGFVWNYRVLPHVHTFVNISSQVS
jgi:hypothetical protein